MIKLTTQRLLTAASSALDSQAVPAAGAVAQTVGAAAQREASSSALLSRAARPALAGSSGASVARQMHVLTLPDRPLLRAVAAELARMDQAFQQRDLKLLDVAGHALSQMDGQHSPDPAARAAHRDALATAVALGNDAQQLLEAVFVGVDTMAKLQAHFELPEHLMQTPAALSGRCQLSPHECMALSLYSVRDKQASPIAPEVFRALNAVMRNDMPAGQQRLAFLAAPLREGMRKLPAVHDTELRRGLQIGPPRDAQTLQDLKAQFRPGQHIALGAPTTGSAIAAYPGNVVTLIHSAKLGSQLRDTSAFSYAHGQKEMTFLPGTRVAVTGCEERTVPPEWAKADALVASSGRAWGDRIDEQVLVVRMRELSPPQQRPPGADT